VTIPRTADDLTPEWLTAVLGDGATVTHARAEPIGVGVGFVGQLVRVSLAWDRPGDDRPDSVIAKLAALGEESRFVATVLNMYGREIGFYRELAASTCLAHPACHYADHDAATQDTVLLLEDVSARGTMRDQLAGARLDEVHDAIDALAAFHAGWWASPQLGEHPWLLRLGDDPYPAAVQLAYAGGWPKVQAMFPELCRPSVRAFGDRYHDAIPRIFERLSEPPLVLSHADYRLDNLFFGPEGVIAIDWQLVDRSVGPRDLAYLVTQSLEIDDPADYRRALDRYVSALRSHGVEVDERWAFESYRWAALLGFVYPVIAGGSLTIEDPRHVELVRALLRRCVAALGALDCFDLIA
jgi:hypothetical protein